MITKIRRLLLLFPPPEQYLPEKKGGFVCPFGLFKKQSSEVTLQKGLRVFKIEQFRNSKYRTVLQVISYDISSFIFSSIVL